MKKIFYFLLLNIFYPSILVAADLSYLFDKQKCADGTVLNHIKPGKHNIFNVSGVEVVLNYSKMEIEKTRDDWRKEVDKNLNKYNKEVCNNKKDCKILKNSQEVKFYNNYSINHSLYLSIPVPAKDLKEVLKKNNIVLVDDKLLNNNSSKERILMVEESFPRDKTSKKDHPELFDTPINYIDYLQLNHGKTTLTVFQINAEKTGNKNTHLLYTCSFSLPSNDDDVSFAQKHKLMYYKK